ncbi:Uncharacterized protein Rs2_40992 [Raphanus sativus]|nr:Uncharacterized protein Rs2_40992 [Raphanus sativus]
MKFFSYSRASFLLISCPGYLLHGELDTGRRQMKRTTVTPVKSQRLGELRKLYGVGVEQDRREEMELIQRRGKRDMRSLRELVQRQWRSYTETQGGGWSRKMTTA